MPLLDSSIAEYHGTERVRPRDTVHSLLEQAAREHPNKTAVVSLCQDDDLTDTSGVFSGTRPLRWTYAHLQQKASHLAANLYALGICDHRSIVTFLDNQAEWALFFWASVQLGSPLVPLSPRSFSRSEEVRYMLDLVSPGAVVVANDGIAKEFEKTFPLPLDRPLVKIVAKHEKDSSISWISLLDIFTMPSKISSLPGLTTGCDDIILIIFTSGTTSKPKACPHSSVTMMSASLAYIELKHVSAAHSSVQHLPSTFIFGITTSLVFWIAGGSVVYPSKVFDAQHTLDAIESERCSHMAAVPAMIHALKDHPSFPHRELKSLISIDLGGALVHPELLSTCKDPNAFGALYASASFGMTETSTATAWNDTDHPLVVGGFASVGKPIAGSKARICEPGSRTPLKRGDLGELHVGGFQVINGYLGIESEAFYKEQSGRENWIITGDQAIMDTTGAISIVGRYKDLIIRGGMNISPAVVEAVLSKATGIIAQVIGIPDEVAGEVPVAIVQRSTEIHTHESLRELVSRDLSVAYVPKLILDLQKDLRLAEFPKTTSGKVQKAKLRALVADYLETQLPPVEMQADDSIKSALTRIWARISGQRSEDISTTVSIHSFADSLMLIQFCNKVKKELAKDIAIEDLEKHNSIEEQVKLLQSRPISQTKHDSKEQRQGPPGIEEMVHCLGDPIRASKTQVAVEQILRKMGLSWDNDVEDVIPMADAPQVMSRRLRPHSWNHRLAFTTTRANCDQLSKALKTCISHHPMFRTVAVDYDDRIKLYVVIRPTDRWFNLSIREDAEVQTSDQLKVLFLNDPKYDYAAVPGPLSRFVVANICSTRNAGLIFNGNHCILDALYIFLWIQDLELVLQNGSLTHGHSSYKKWADKYFQYRNGPSAQASCDFHVRRLEGLSESKQALWPPQRAPGWFKGNDKGWLHLNGSLGIPEERKFVDGDNAKGLEGLTRSFITPYLSTYNLQHGISTPVLLKGACALMNTHLTGAKEAIFSNAEAGRSWPFVEDWGEADRISAINPMDVAGPTVETVINRISVGTREPTSRFLQNLQDEQKQLTKHAHAPLYLVRDMIASSGVDGVAGTFGLEEADIIDGIARRQGFNWLPGAQSRVVGQEGHDEALQRVQAVSRADTGLQWNCGLLSSERVFIHATYDDAQLGEAEVTAALDIFVRAAQWLVDPENWEKLLGEWLQKE